jgi:hypothetical protein
MLQLMKTVALLLAAVALAGCSSPSGSKTGSASATAASLTAPADTAPRYEHRLVMEYSDGATPFLELVRASDL